MELTLFSFLNVCLWLLNLLLKSISHNPKYFLVSIPGQFTKAQYTIALSRQLPFRGHPLLTSTVVGFYCLIIVSAIQKLLVVLEDHGCYVWHAAIAHLDVVAVTYFSQPVSAGEMLVQ